MKKIYLFLLMILILSSIVFAEVSPSDKTQIQNQVTLITNSVNNNDIDAILNILSENARSGLKDEIEINLRGKTIQFQQSISSYEDLENNKIKVKGRYAAEGIGWSIKGLSNYYIFEKSNDGSWLLVDTNFHKVSAKSVFKVISIVFGILGFVFLILFIFWLWMLIDCATRQFEDKVVWILIIIFLNLLGAILYFFFVRRKLKKQQKKFSKK